MTTGERSEGRETAVNLKLRSNLNSPSENGISSTFMLEKGASSPTNDRKGFDFSKVNGKLLCILNFYFIFVLK